MNVESIMQTCAELGIKLTLKGDDSDRLQVDAPKGALTAPVREALAAHKTDIVAALKAEQLAHQSQDPDETVTRIPARKTPNSEATPLILEQPLANPPTQLDRTEVEVNKLLSGSDYDGSVVDAKDSVTRQHGGSVAQRNVSNAHARLCATFGGRRRDL